MTGLVKSSGAAGTYTGSTASAALPGTSNCFQKVMKSSVTWKPVATGPRDQISCRMLASLPPFWRGVPATMYDTAVRYCHGWLSTGAAAAASSDDDGQESSGHVTAVVFCVVTPLLLSATTLSTVRLRRPVGSCPAVVGSHLASVS